MTKARIREIGSMLRQFGDYSQNSYFRTTVEIEEDEYYVDLGAFGEQCMSVTLQRDEYEIDLDDVLNEFPFDSSTMIELGEELEEYEDEDVASLDDVLARMEGNGQAMLAKALKAVKDAFEGMVAKASDMTGLSVGPLPAKPLPWPGALRPEIDYTAADFTMRYQPPPGFDWTQPGSSTRVRYTDAVQMAAAEAGRASKMVMDRLGRVKYTKTDVRDDYQSGFRWHVWHLDRDGIPCGAGFNMYDMPRAIERDGTTVEGRTNWDDDDLRTAFKRLAEIRQEYENGAPFIVAAEVEYDPLTVLLEEGSSLVTSEDLRLGDLITGQSFGRVVKIENDTIYMNRDGVQNLTPYSATFKWDVIKINVPNRDQLPTAASLQPAAV